MSRAPNGVPTISYCRILPAVNVFGPADIATDGNAIVVHESGQPPLRFEVAQVIDKTISDEEACELTFGNRAGVGLGAPLNPVSAFVNDAANVVVLLTGSRMTKKWQFLKRTFLPFLANEMINTISERSQDPSVNNYKAQLTLSSFEIQDEIISDLLRPANRGLSISTTLEEGVIVQGLHRETVVDEMTLRKLLVDACDNRAVQSLPVGGSIDTSSGVFEFRLYQSDSGNNMVGHAVYQSRECYSRLIVVDVPSVDPLLASNAEEMRLLAGPTLNKSLFTFMDVAKKLNNPYRAQIAPFRSAKLPHFLSELLGGNAIVVAMGQVVPGEAACSKRTMEMLAALNSAIHYPMGARELSDSLRGLLGKYRAMMMHMQDEMTSQSHNQDEHVEQEKSTAKMIEKLQKELAQAITDKTAAVDDRNRIFEMTELLKAKYNTVMEEKLKQSEQLAQVEEDNIALAKTIVELNLKISTDDEQHEKEKFEWSVQLLQRDTKLTALEEEIKQLHETIENQKDDLAEKSQIIAGNNKVIAELKDSLETKSNQLSEQKEKNVELGAELLTLVNHKDLLQQEFNALKEKYDEMNEAKEKITSKEEKLEEDVRRLLEKIVIKDEEIAELRKVLMDANESVTHLKYEMTDIKRESEAKELSHLEKEKHLEEEQEEIRLNAERLAAELAAKEAAPPVIIEVIKEIPAPIVEPAPIAEPVEPEKPKTPPPPVEVVAEPVKPKDTGETVRRAVDVMKLESMDKKEKGFLRKQFELEKQLQRLTNDFTNEKHVSADLDKELKALQIKYKDALRSSLMLGSSSSSSDLKKDAGVIPTDHALLSMLNNYEQREEILKRRNEVLFQSRSDIISSYRALYDHYKHAVETMEDMTTILTDPRYKSNDKKMGIDLKLKSLVESALQEQYTFSLAQLSASENQINDIEQNERQDTYEDRKTSSQYEIESKERIAAIISTYQHQLQQKEENLAQLQQQYINLQIQTKQLIGQQTLNPAALNKEHATQQEKMFKEEMESSAQHYQNLCSEIQELRKQLMNKDISANQVTSRKPSAHLIQVLKDVVASSTPVPSTPSDKSRFDSKPSGDEERVSSPATLFPSPPPPTKAIKSKEHEELRSQLIAAESRSADLVSKQVAMQEELKSYQTYMKEIIPQYQKQIAQLQAQLQKRKATVARKTEVQKDTQKIENIATIPEKEVEELKLPPIV